MTDNQKKAEQYLNQIKTKAEKIFSLKLEIEALEYAASGATGIRYDKDQVQTSPRGDRLEIFVTDAVERQAEADEVAAELDELKVNAYHIIRQLDNIDERNILEWVYLQATPMQSVVQKMNWSERKVYYLRDDALEHFGEKFADDAVECKSHI